MQSIYDQISIGRMLFSTLFSGGIFHVSSPQKGGAYVIIPSVTSNKPNIK